MPSATIIILFLRLVDKFLGIDAVFERFKYFNAALENIQKKTTENNVRPRNDTIMFLFDRSIIRIEKPLCWVGIGVSESVVAFEPFPKIAAREYPVTKKENKERKKVLRWGRPFSKLF